MSRSILVTRAAALALLLVLASSAGVTAGATAGPRLIDRTPVVDDIIPDIAPPIDFGQVIIGTTTAAEDFVYTNGWATPQAVVVTLVGANPGDFTISADGCTGTPVAAGATCTVGIAFSPTAEATRTATVKLDINVGNAETDVPLTGVGVLQDSSVTWGPYTNVGGAYTSTNATALARTVSGPTEYLHAIVERYDVARWGIYYRRSTNGGASWPYVVRVNPSSQFGVRSTEAAAGSHVYVAWSSLVSANPSSSQPRPLWFRSNGHNGSGTWSTVRRLTASTSRIDYPKIAAAGANVYITYTNAANGDVNVKVSHDYGSTWTTVKLGTTSRMGWSGRLGVPAVAAYGSTVAVAWISSNFGGTVKFRASATRGVAWTPAVTLGTGAVPGTWPSISAVGTRIAVAWTGPTAMRLRIRTGSAWTPTRSVLASAGAPQAYAVPGIGQVMLSGATRVAIAAEWCWAGCAASDPASAYRSDVVWRESATDGATWAKSQTVVPSGPDPFEDYDYAYLPSVLWPSATTRYLMAAHWYSLNLLDNIVILAGRGTP